MKELQVTEALFNKGKKKGAEAHLAINRASTLGTKKFKSRWSKKASKPSRMPNILQEHKVDKSVDRSNYYNRLGHWKHNCIKNLKELRDKKEKGNLFVIHAYLATDSIHS